MANTVEVEVIARLDKIEKQLKDFSKDTEKTLGGFSLPINLAGFNQGLELAKKALNAFQQVGEAAINAVMDAEKIKAFNNQFEALAKQAGIAGDVLRNALGNAANGLVDDSDMIASANKALIQLGQSATKLPETMELARKATTAFGGDVLQNFELINQAVASGNTRSLRQIGIVIDQEKAIKDYARSLGVSADALSQTGRQQAILNAVLEKGGTNFKNVNDNALTATNEFTRLKVAIKDAGDSFKLAFESTFGPALASMAKGLTSFVKQLTGTNSLDEQLQIINTRLKEIKASGLEATMGGEIARLEQKASKLRDQMEFAAESQRKLNSVARTAAATPASALIDPVKAEADRQKVQQVMFQANNDRLAAELQHAQITGNAAAIEQIQAEQRFAVIQEFELRRQELENQYLETGLMNKAQFAGLEVQLEEQKKAKIELLKKQASQNFNEIEKAGRMALVNGLASSFAAVGAALAKGQNAFQAFAGAIISALGMLAIQIGTMLVATGLGFQAAGAIMPAWAVAGAGTVAAGLALITLGGAMQALGSGASGGGGDTGGGVAAGGGGLSSGSAATQEAEVDERKPQTAVTVNVQGNILDRRQTGLEIAEVINETFGSNGIVIASGAIA